MSIIRHLAGDWKIGWCAGTLSWLVALLRSGRATASVRCQQRANRRFVRLAIVCADQVPDLLAIFAIEERRRNLAAPSRQDHLHKRIFSARSLAVIRERRLVAHDKPAHKDQIAVLVEIDANDMQSPG